jgi:hypothetical protein
MLTEIRPIEHFKEMVSKAIARQGVRASREAEFYLTNLLSEFVDCEKFSNSMDEPMALTFLKSLEKRGFEQAVVLRSLGDSSLFVSGFFSDSLARKLVDIDYYIGMGSTAYRRLANNSEENTSPIFGELSYKFVKLVDVLAEVSERSRLTSSEDILRLYERWLRTGSPHTTELLKELGIEPVTVTTEPVH